MTNVKPFLRWAGGKRQLLSELEPRLPTKIDYYIEPFLGSGALFFSIHDRIQSAQISDINSELINAYNAIQQNLEGLIEELKKHNNTEEYFLHIRDADRQAEYDWKWSPIQKAARFIFLNKTCFNGLYRVNSKGQFNVPFGHRENPNIVDEANLQLCNQILNKENISINCCSFIDTINMTCPENTFVYLDPPYVPLNISSNFTAYTKDGFGMKEQNQLLEFCNRLDRMGTKWMQSNSSAPIVYQMYSKYHIEEVDAKRSVGANKESRIKVKEVIIRNYK